jgi:hypothetical protein
MEGLAPSLVSSLSAVNRQSAGPTGDPLSGRLGDASPAFQWDGNDNFLAT